MVLYIRWKRWIRSVTLVSVLFFIIRIWNSNRNSNLETDKGISTVEVERAKESHKKEIHVVIGHYVGDTGNAGSFMQNISQDMLNDNLFSPRIGEGKDGRAVLIPPQETAQMQQLFAINRFNLLASDRIPLNRSLPDVRRKGCAEYYDKYEVDKLPDVSVIIIFHNEAWSTLLRTVTSVVNRSPRSLLREIILIDDASERNFLGSPLEEFLKEFDVPTHVLRTHVRSGLVRARLLGARAASGGVLVFLDSHCECTIGWLEPLVIRIAEDRTRVVCPVIDIINDNTFAYVRSFELHWGAFNWHLHFRWYTIGIDEIKRRKKNVLSPFKTPAMAGGLYAIDRSYFFEVGAYDEGMDIWGGENLEMSFRIWQCGGSVEISPCSHVGHLFRKSTPYSFPGGIGDILNANLARVALVWMDEWADFFFHFNPEAAKQKHSVSVQHRKQLRHQLQCRSFKWYLSEVWPEHFYPMEDRFFGQVRSRTEDKCLQNSEGNSHHPVGPLAVGPCYNYSDVLSYPGKFLMHQLFVFAQNGAIMTDESVCMDISRASKEGSRSSSRVNLIGCSGDKHQRWKYKKENGVLVHNSTGLCLEVLSQTAHNKTSQALKTSSGSSEILVLNQCNENFSQQWILKPVRWK